MCQQNISHEAEVLCSDVCLQKESHSIDVQVCFEVISQHHQYVGTKEQVHHLYYIYVRLTMGYQTTPEIKAGQENIAHLLSKYNSSKLLVQLSAIII